MRVGRDEVGQVAIQEFFADALRAFAESTEDTAGRNLRERPQINEPLEAARIFGENHIPLRMRDDRCYA